MNASPSRRVRLAWTLSTALAVCVIAACGGKIDEGDSTMDVQNPGSPPDPGAVPLPPSNGPLDQPLSVADCASRPFANEMGTTAVSVVDNWLAPMVSACQATGAKSCGNLTVHFSRQPEPSCADDLRFTEPPRRAFVACMAKMLAAERNGGGNFVDGDEVTIALCP